MLLKKITSALFAIGMLGMVMIPISATASTLDNGGIEVCSGEAGTVCHCGGIRQVSRIETRTFIDNCPEHGVSCGNYYYMEIEYFYHCSNPSCTDTWYVIAPDENYYSHIYGR